MTSPTILIQRAAELVIEFGLEHTGMSAAEVRNATSDSGLIVRWRSPCERRTLPSIELVVHRRTNRIETRTSVEVDALPASDARRVHDLYGRVVELAERIEALR
jgi:hypothetical protein